MLYLWIPLKIYRKNNEINIYKKLLKLIHFLIIRD